MCPENTFQELASISTLLPPSQFGYLLFLRWGTWESDEALFAAEMPKRIESQN